MIVIMRGGEPTLGPGWGEGKLPVIGVIGTVDLSASVAGVSLVAGRPAVLFAWLRFEGSVMLVEGLFMARTGA